MHDRAVELEFFPRLAKNRVHAVEVAQRPQDGAVVNRLWCFVVASDDDDGDFGVAEAFELFEAESERPIRGAGAVEKIAGVDDHVRFYFQNSRHHALESVVYVLLAGVDALGGHMVEGLEAEVGVGAVDDCHSLLVSKPQRRGDAEKIISENESALRLRASASPCLCGEVLSIMQANIPHEIRRRRVSEFEVSGDGDDLAAMVGAVVHAVVNHQVARAAVFGAVEESEMADFGESRVGKRVDVGIELFRYFRNAVENIFRCAVENLGQKGFGRHLAQSFEPYFFGAPDV